MMGINRMKEVAQLFGVELGEEFKINLCPNVLFQFDTNGIYTQEKGGCSWHSANQSVLQELICGNFEIIKLPWNPKNGDTYYTYMGKDWYAGESSWDGDATDFKNLKAECVFRTREEAKNARPTKYKELTGRDYNA